MRDCKIKFASILLIFLFPLSLQSVSNENSRLWSIDDVLNLESADSFDISPCGKYVIWTKSRPDKEENSRVNDIYLSSLVDSTEIQLTRGKFNDRSPKWSPDGKHIAFLSAREKEKGAQIWLMNSGGGEPWSITDLKNGVNFFAWRCNKSIIFSAREDPTQFENELKEKKDDAIVIGDEEHYWPVRLFQINIKSKTIQRLTDNTGKISEFELSPDGKWVVTSEAQNVHYPYDHRIPPKQFLYNLVEKTRLEIFRTKNEKPSGFVWELDGSGFYCSQPISSDPDENYVSVQTLYYFDLASRKYQRVELNWDWQLGFFGYFMTRDGLLVSLANGTKNRLTFFKKQRNGWKRTFSEEKQADNIFVNAVNKQGDRLIFTYSTASTPPQIKAGKIESFKFIEQKQILHLNKFLDKKDIPNSEVINWKGAKGDKVEGILYYPFQFEQGKKYPLMCVIHGGPAGADIDGFSERWSNYPNLLASKGCFVLKVNYHGSGNYGLKWVESIKKHYYEYEVPDILNGVDYLINKGLVDADKLGIMGWSNGAILAIACVIETNRFKVCASGAGDVNWISDYGNCAFGAGFDNAYFGGPPWKRLKHYIDKSPLFKMEKVSTPTIIFFGTNDTSVPTQQGWEHYRALQQIGKTPVRFLLFLGEPHGFRKISHQRRKIEEELAWFDKYLFDTHKESVEALKKDSPLALEFKKRQISKIVGYYGIKEKGLLAPEVVMVNDSLKIGCFEVTRAQFMVYNHHIIYSLGTDDFPINNVSFEQAKEYCRWLSNVTGKNYDLPREEEMKLLQDKNKSNQKNENTLDYWAGYSPNPDEVAELDAKIAELELTGLLLMQVGSRNPVSEKLLIFDIDGNAAEWCIGQDGEGIVLGGSAVTPTDAKINYAPPRMEYVGFRVALRE